MYTGTKLRDWGESRVPSDGEEEECRLGLKIKMIIKPKMIRSKRKMIFRRPVFF